MLLLEDAKLVLVCNFHARLAEHRRTQVRDFQQFHQRYLFKFNKFNHSYLMLAGWLHPHSDFAFVLNYVCLIAVLDFGNLIYKFVG
jgi:hypothetical protein